MYLSKVIILNRAPFENLNLDLEGKTIHILSGINGKGKTSLLSYIVDCLYEMAKLAFSNEFGQTINKYYRVSSNLDIINSTKPSLVYLRFSDNNEYFDYIDIRGNLTNVEYENAICLKDKIFFGNFESELLQNNNIKYLSIQDPSKIKKIFSSNMLTYFPAYRFEEPAYLNDPYSVSLSFKKDYDFAGYLPNKIEVTSNLSNIANWLMDIVLDSELYKGNNQSILNCINKIFNTILYPKSNTNLRIGIGPRQNGAARVSLVKKNTGEVMYPSIFGLSSGELALAVLFCELLKQADKINCQSNNVSGIVLIDEIDKHLHIKLQKEILPELIQLFPNVQFIVSSHSPFFNMGLYNSPLPYKIFDLDNGGICCTPYNNELFLEVYEILVSENNRFAQKFFGLKNKLNSSLKPLVITEGKTDWKHLKAAQKALGLSDIEIEFSEYEDDLGDSKLLQLLKDIGKLNPKRKIIGIFDRDNDQKSELKELIFDEKYRSLSPNIYILRIPLVNESIYGKSISIEHYYIKRDLLKETKEHRRLFLGKEFYKSGNSIDGKYQTKISQIQNKVQINGIIDEKVYLSNDLEQITSVALSKNDFANLILGEDEFAKGFDFSNFATIFEIIKDICNNLT